MTATETITPSQNKIIPKKDEKSKKPAMYVVVVHNDPVTPRGFVVDVLQRYFRKTPEEAQKIMLLAHNYGFGAVATYTFEIAETKASLANSYGRDQGYPLFFSLQDA